MSGAAGVALLAVLAMLAVLNMAFSQSDWQVGRATFYGTDDWSIHQGSCGFYYIFDVSGCPVCFGASVAADPEPVLTFTQSEPLGWDVAAMSDANPMYPGSCGYESVQLETLAHAHSIVVSDQHATSTVSRSIV